MNSRLMGHRGAAHLSLWLTPSYAGKKKVQNSGVQTEITVRRHWLHTLHRASFIQNEGELLLSRMKELPC